MAKEITNEQLFEFMTGMYSELSGKIDGMYGEMQEGFKEIRKDMATKQDLTRLENKMVVNHKALYDTRGRSLCALLAH